VVDQFEDIDLDEDVKNDNRVKYFQESTAIGTSGGNTVSAVDDLTDGSITTGKSKSRLDKTVFLNFSKIERFSP